MLGQSRSPLIQTLLGRLRRSPWKGQFVTAHNWPTTSGGPVEDLWRCPAFDGVVTDAWGSTFSDNPREYHWTSEELQRRADEVGANLIMIQYVDQDKARHD